MTTRKVRRAVTASILVAASCNVYNPSLLVGHGGAAGSNTGAAGGAGGSSGVGAQAGSGNNAGSGVGGASGMSGTSAGGTAGRASGGSAGSSGGSGNESGGGGEGGEAGAMMGEGGTVSAGTGGTAGGVSGGGGSAGTGASAGTGGAAGTGGTAGTGDVAGMGGTAGMTGGTAGMGGAVGGAGMGGMGGAPATGCANLTVPLVNASDKAHFVITLTNAANMSAAATNISMRVYVLAGSGGNLLNYVQDTGNRFMAATTTRPALSTLVGVWTTLTWNVGSETAVNGIDKANIKRIGIEVTANNASPLTNPTKIYVDWVSTSVITPVPTFPFDTSGTVDTTASAGVDVGGQVLWLNSASSDTTATGVTLGWLTSCP